MNNLYHPDPQGDKYLTDKITNILIIHFCFESSNEHRFRQPLDSISTLKREKNRFYFKRVLSAFEKFISIFK